MQDESNASSKIKKPLTALGTRSAEGIPASPFVLHHPRGVGKGKGGRGWWCLELLNSLCFNETPWHDVIPAVVEVTANTPNWGPP